MVRSRTWPSPGAGAAYSSIRKSEAFGSPTGRETRMTRFADWDMVFPPGILLFVIASVAKQSILAKRKDGLLPPSLISYGGQVVAEFTTGPAEGGTRWPPRNDV